MLHLTISAAVLLAVLCLAESAAKKRIVLDVDGVTDDCQALTLALQTPEIEVLAVSTVSGSTNSYQGAANVARTLRANKAKKIPIYKGADGPLADGAIDYSFSEKFFGKDGLGDSPNEDPKVLPGDFKAYDPNKPAAVALVELFRKNKDRNVTLVTTGPLTNIATALQLEPEFANWPGRLVVMGGTVYAMGNLYSTSTAESNFGLDPEASYIVLKKMNVPITVVTWESAVFVRERREIDCYAHVRLDKPLSRWLELITRAPRTYKQTSGSQHQYCYCDEATIGYVIDEVKGVKEVQVRAAAIELHGKYTRGQVAIDWSGRGSGFPYNNSTNGDFRPVTFVVNYNEQFLDQQYFNAINKFK
ncbi:Protein Y43F8C.13 [Aphelenchoides avenae]|nr:Protein Y43F8C.13 [Aphelenchus avenae]